MNQLRSFLSTLTPEELTLVNSIKLKGKEKEVYRAILQIIQTGKETDVCANLEITETHYYKVCSVILQKFYAAVIPGLGTELLIFLLHKRLYAQFKHEIPKQEKLLKKLNPELLEKYYLNAFHLLIDLPFKQYDKKLRQAIGEKYINSNSSFGKAEQAYIKFHSLFSDANRLAAQKNPLKAFDHDLNDLLKFEEELSGTDYYLAKYYLYRTFCSYYSYYEFNPEKNIEYLKKAIQLKDNIDWFFPIDIGQFLALLLADALFVNNQIDEAYEKYQQIFSEQIDPNMYGFHYHCEQFAILLIIKKNFKEAESFISKIFDQEIKLKNDIYAARGYLSYAKLYLSNNELPSAIRHINTGKNENEKSYYLPFDFQYRVLENIYFLKKGDFDFALKLAQKNLKFVTSQKKDSQLYVEYLQLFKLFIELSKEQKSSDEIKRKAEKFNEKLKNLYANLIQEVFEIC